MSIGKWKFAMTHLFFSVFLIVYNAAISLNDTSSKVTQSNNPFRSLLPEKNNSVSLPQSLSKSVSTKKQNPSLGKKKSTEKAALSKSAAQLHELKTASRTDISSRTKQITETLSLKDILETSEGRYAFIDEKKVSYVVQEGEWLEKVFVKTIYKNSVELQEIDGETTIILTLQP
jgi:hypothetical protein